ncbi:MAG: flagellar basal body protein FliL [Deltaproteobacteria bacterium]|nr:MAG: flagellar basal body protein FliL [Deltaproteobacteria bacterium]
MAEEEKEAVKEQEEESPDKKSPMKLIILAVVLVLLLGGGAFAWKSGMLNSVLGGEDKDKTAKTVKEDPKHDIGPVYALAPFIVNLNEPLGKRYLKVKVEIELDNGKMQSEMEKRLPQFRDGILTLLSSKSYKDISDLSGKYELRAEILGMVNGYLKTGKVRNVYFTEFIVQ